jgi:hypothetical protein
VSRDRWGRVILYPRRYGATHTTTKVYVLRQVGCFKALVVSCGWPRRVVLHVQAPGVVIDAQIHCCRKTRFAKRVRV